MIKLIEIVEEESVIETRETILESGDAALVERVLQDAEGRGVDILETELRALTPRRLVCATLSFKHRPYNQWTPDMSLPSVSRKYPTFELERDQINTGLISKGHGDKIRGKEGQEVDIVWEED